MSNITKMEIVSESFLFDDILTYAGSHDCIKNFITDGLSFDPFAKDDNKKHIVKKKIGHGRYILKVNDKSIIINYQINENNPVGLSHVVKCHEKLILESEHGIDVINEFIKLANEFSKPKNKKMVSVKIFKNFWLKLNNLPIRDMDTIYLDKKIKDNILNDITDFLNEEEVYNSFGIPYKKTYLFEGIPGTGKSSLIFALASHLNMDISIFNFGPDVDDAIFMKAISTMPPKSVLLLEDVDSLFVQRESKAKSYITFSGILNTLDGVSRRHGLITFITTNFLDRLDKALVRPGRIDYIINFTYATKEQIDKMFKKFRPNDDSFEKFYDLIKNKEYTTAIFQKFFFANRKNKSILDKIGELEEIKNIHSNKKDDDAPEFMYI